MANGSDDKLPGSHQESIAAAIACCDDDNSNLITNLVDPTLLDPPYTDIIARCIAYRRQFKRPPGKGHLDDVFAHIFEDKTHKSYQQYDTIINKLVQHGDRLDTNYVLRITDDFVRLRKMRLGIAKAAERYQKGGEMVMEDLEAIFRQNLKIRDQGRDYGFSLADDRAFGFLERDVRDYCNIGIKELDQYGIVPTKKELMAFLSPPNRGKSWYLTHCGKYALLKGWKVLHYTLENSDDMTAQRYFQTLFNGVRYAGNYHYVEFDRQDENAVKLRTVPLTPDFIIEDQDQTSTFLVSKQKDWKHRLANLRIRRFASGRMSYDDLERDLDEMMITHKFQPDLVMIDMPQLMKMPRRDRDYASLDELITNLRGTAVDRNLAMVVPQQGNRSSNETSRVQAQHGAGSFGVFGIADNLITFSQTASEEKHGLARLYTQKVRNAQARRTIVLSQHYESGQFCVDSHPMDARIRDEIKTYTGAKPGEDDGDE